MRILLSMMFFAPIVGYAALQSGAQQITPYLLALTFVAMISQVFVERRRTQS